MSNQVPQIIDISSWKQDIDHAKVAAAGVKVAICRTTCSQVSADLSYMYHKREFAKHGVNVPGYMFPHFQHDVVFQVKCFLAMLDDDWFPPIVDLERDNYCDSDVVARKTTLILNEIKSRTMRIPMIYTRGMWFDRIISPYVSWQGQYPLWVAHYTKWSIPIIPKGWKNYVLWQYTDEGRVEGIKSSVDFNRLSGDISDVYKNTYLTKILADENHPTYPSW